MSYWSEQVIEGNQLKVVRVHESQLITSSKKQTLVDENRLHRVSPALFSATT
jgi:hypothetical protein